MQFHVTKGYLGIEKGHIIRKGDEFRYGDIVEENSIIAIFLLYEV